MTALAKPPYLASNPPYNGCQCDCHYHEGVNHFVACCSPMSGLMGDFVPSCGCGPHRLCAEHHRKAMEFLGSPTEGVTITTEPTAGETP
jgi:hypothetical protein